jgi:hypothetical protein
MYQVIEYNPTLDLSEFYSTAESKGFYNNSSKHMLIDSISKESEWNVWLLQYDNKFVGSVAAHSFNIMGDNCYRICARTCVFTDMLPGTYGKNLRTVSVITEHQNPTAQFFIPTCIDWTPKGSRLFITTNESAVGTQQRVHKIFAPTLEKLGQMKYIKDEFYRGTKQSIWEIFPDKFYETLNKYPRWI